MASPDEIRAWAREQGMKVSDRGRLSGVVIGAYEAATGDLADLPVEDMSPEPPGAPGRNDTSPEVMSPFVPGDSQDPKPARTRQKGKTHKAATAAVIGDIQGKTAFILTMPAMAWQARDPYCGAVAVQQVPDISRALATLFAQSPEVVEWFTGKGGNFMAWLDLAAACQPLLTAVIGHHVTHSAGPQEQAGRFAIPDDQYAA